MYLVKLKKSPYYYLVYRIGNNIHKKSTKEKTKAAALNFLNKFNIDQQREIFKKPILFSQFKNEYKDFVEISFSKSYLRHVKYSLEQLQNYTGDIALSDISKRILESFLLSIFNKSKYSAFQYFRNLRAAVYKAIEWNYLTENHLRGYKFPRLPKVQPLFLSESEFEQIINKVPYSLFVDVYYTLFHTGIRAAELVNLKWSNVDLPNRIITICSTKDFITKGKKDRIIPINDKLLHVLGKRVPKIIQLDKEQFVFSRIPGIKLTVDHISKKFKEAVRAAKLNDKIHLHSLRHSFASILVQKGASLYVVKELLGHEDLKTTQIYAHLQHQNLVDAVNLLN